MSKQQGFTITELMFAMAFLAVLMIILLGSVIEITRVYNKGITLKRVNQSGRTIAAELGRAMQQASPTNIKYQAQEQGEDQGGRLCLGKYSFVWNVQDGEINKYSDGDTAIHFIKVADSNGNLCRDDAGGPLPDIDPSDAKELLGNGLVVRSPANQATRYKEFTSSGNSALVGLRFTLATAGNADIISDDGREKCQGGSSNDFCALNTFNVIVYAKGG